MTEIEIHKPKPKVPDFSGSRFRFRDNPTLPRLRRDLKIVEHMYRGRASYVVKDPVSLRYYRLGPLEYFVSSLLDGRRTVAEVHTKVMEKYGENHITEDDLKKIITMLLNMSLLELNSEGARQLAEHLKASHKKLLRKTRFLRQMGKVISFRITLCDPDLLLIKLNKKLAFLWSLPAALVLLALVLSTIILVVVNWTEATAKTPDFFSLENMALVWFVMIAVKIVHEFGHGLSCKKFGGEVHEMGIMFIVFSPFLFCNATDSWMLKNKWKRIAVNLGGIYLELFLASAAAWVWVLTEPSFLNNIAFNIMIVCSVATIFMNLNPLMKFDGYYVMSDFAEIPNMKERGDRFLMGKLAEWFTGFRLLRPDPIAETLKLRLALYAVASYGWMVMMVFGILKILGHTFKDTGLDRPLQIGAGLTLLIGLGMPLFMLAKNIASSIKMGADPRILWKRVLGSLGVLAAIFLIPFPHSVKTTCVLDGEQTESVNAETAGFVEDILVSPGEGVQEGQLLARLRNSELDALVWDVGKALEMLALMQNTALAAREANGELPDLRTRDAQLRAQLRELQARQAALEMRAPVTGIVLTSGLSELKGQLFQPGQKLLEILPGDTLEARVALTDAAAGLVEEGQHVSFRLRSFPNRRFEGEVIRTSLMAERELPHAALGEAAGGGVRIVGVAPVKNAPGTIQTAQPFYTATVALENTEGFLRPGMAGRLKIQTGWTNGFSLLKHWLREKIRKDFQL